jgi:hypothetical protein
MGHNKNTTRIIMLFLLLFLGNDLFSQVKVSPKDYQPEPGQEGKDVRWFPTPQTLIEKMLDMAKITPADYLVDLGSGEGRVVISAAKRGLHATGVEYNHDLVELSKKNAALEGVSKRTEFIEADLFNYDFSKATVITIFLLPEINLRLRPKLLNMKPGTRIISTTFTMQDWQHDDMVRIADNSSQWTTAYLWIVPEKIGGTWKFKDGELRLAQKFQMISGEIIKDGKTTRITSGKLSGNDFTFTAGGTVYSGIADKKTMKGTAETGGRITEWTAQKIK